jgi:amino acid permease
MERSFQFLVSDVVLGEKGSARKAFFNFFKSMFGAGILTFANAFSQVGLGLGVPTFLLCYATICVTTYMLLDCYRIATMLTGREVRSYEDVAGFVFGPRGKRAIQHALAALQVLLCTGFLIAYADNMTEVLPGMSRRAVVGMAFPVLFALSCISSLKDMWLISLLGLAVYLLGVLLLSTYDGAAHFREDPEDLTKFQLSGLGHFLGVSAYAFEGIGLILPTVSSMQRPASAPVVVFGGLSLYAAITLTFGAFTYAAGLGSCDIITTCLEHGLPTTGVRAALSVALLLTYPVYILVPARILELRLGLRRRSAHHLVPVAGDDLETQSVAQSVDHSLGSSGFTGSYNYAPGPPASSRISTQGRSLGGTCRTYTPLSVLLLRLFLVAATCMVAASGIRASTFTVLVGAVLTTFVAFIAPALMWWRMYALLQRLRADGAGAPTAPLLAKQSGEEDSESIVTTSTTTARITAAATDSAPTSSPSPSADWRGGVAGAAEAWFEALLPAFGSRRPVRGGDGDVSMTMDDDSAVAGSPAGYRAAPEPGPFPPLSWRGRALALGALVVGGAAMLTGVVEAADRLLNG